MGVHSRRGRQFAQHATDEECLKLSRENIRLRAALKKIADGDVPNPNYDWAERDYAAQALSEIGSPESETCCHD